MCHPYKLGMPDSSINTLAEPSRDTPLAGSYDVIVCGGGPAGIAAAVSAARHGAKTALLEVHGCLGGVWTAGSLSWILDSKEKGGIMEEILQRLGALGARAMDPQGMPTPGYDPEAMKWVLDQMAVEAGVDVWLHTRVVSAQVGGDQRLTHVLIESKSGREALAGKAFVDCTGDGDLAARAGCGFDLGHPESGKTQPMSLMGLFTGLDPQAISDFFVHRATSETWNAPKDRLHGMLAAHGVETSYGKPTFFCLAPDLFALMANHQYGVSALDTRQLTAATLEARDELHRISLAFKKEGGVWKNARLVATGAQIGVREARRIHGRATVTLEDLRVGRSQPDAVCRVHFCIDVHSLDGKGNKGLESQPVKALPYDIPAGALIARDVEGLYMAGRCISGDFWAHSSYRVTGNAVAMGESAGRMAAEAA